MNNRKYYLVVIGTIMLFCFYSRIAYAQQDSNKIIVYFELFGTSDIYSFNGEYLIKGKHSIQAGLSWVPGTWQMMADNDRSFYYFPVGYHYLMGKGRHKLDLFAGLVYTLTHYYESPNNHKFKPQTGLSYRFQVIKGLFFRSGFIIKIPINLSADKDDVFFYTEQHWLFWPSAALGYRF